jgi:hypothetical protein
LCLRHYGYNSRSVIDALLDDKKMPLDLRRLHGQLLVATDVPDGQPASPLLSPSLDQHDGQRSFLFSFLLNLNIISHNGLIFAIFCPKLLFSFRYVGCKEVRDFQSN